MTAVLENLDLELEDVFGCLNFDRLGTLADGVLTTGFVEAVSRSDDMLLRSLLGRKTKACVKASFKMERGKP